MGERCGRDSICHEEWCCSVSTDGIVTSLEIEYAPHFVQTSCFLQFVLFALGLEQMSQLKVIRILIYMWGTAVWVVLATGTTDWAASNPDGPATAAAGPAPAAI